MSKWYVCRDSMQQGPFPSSTLKQLVESGTVQATDIVRLDDATEWQSAGRVPGLFPKRTAADTPPPLPQERRLISPGLLVYIRHHWKQTRGTWFIPALIGPFLIPAASIFKPVIGWSNLALFTGIIGTLSFFSFILYLISRSIHYARGKWIVTEECTSRLARVAHDAGILSFPILTSVIAIEYFAPERGVLIAAIPKLQVLQDDLINHQEPLPSIVD